MYRKILDDYFVNYESVIKGTMLYNEASFKEMRDRMDEAFEEQEKQYETIKNVPLVGKDELVKFLKEYRDNLNEMVDTYAEILKGMP